MSLAPPIEIVSREEQTVLVLRGSLSLADASALREAAVTLSIAAASAGESASERRSVCLDLSEVESIDVGILQIWAALDAELVRHARPLLVQGISEALLSHCAAAGWRGFAGAA